MCAGIAIPVLGLLAFLLWQSASSERERMEREGLLSARTVATDVDRDLTTLTSTLQALSHSQSLQQGDLATFHAVASRLARMLDLAVVLFDGSGQQLANTRRAWGDQLPKVHPEVQRGLPVLLQTRRPYVTDVFTGQIAQEPLFVIMVPVFRAGTEEIIYLLQLSAPSERIRGIILSTVRPEQGLALVADRRNVTLARNRTPERLEGVESRMLTQARSTDDGKFRSTTAAGTSVLVFTAPIRNVGWTVAVGVEEEMLHKPVRDLMRLLLATTGLMILLSAALATVLGRRITRSLGALTDSALALGERRALPVVRTPIREVNAVGEAHVTAARDLGEALAAKEALLYEVNHRVKNSLALVTSLLALQARRTPDPDLRRLLSDVRGRIDVVASVHQRLYESGRHDRLEIGPFLAEIAKGTVRAYDPDGRVALDLAIEDGLVLKIGDATPLVLLTAELLTNAVKHAFADGRSGRIALSLRREPDHRVALEVADDGPGLPPGLDPSTSGSTGMRIVTALARQIRGELRVVPGRPGARFALAFLPSD